MPAHTGNVDRRRLLPPLQWLPGYQAAWLKHDLVSGFTFAAYAIPVSMAHASLAGLAPQHGIYCYLLGGACYAVFGASRQFAIGPTSAISLLLGATIGGMIDGDPGRWLGIASLTALTVAGLSLLAWLIRLSELVSFISETILIGFKTGAALVIAMTQLPKLFGVKGGGSNFFVRLWITGD
jgi:MFS superfamily sulfate permease-like transporter